MSQITSRPRSNLSFEGTSLSGPPLNSALGVILGIQPSRQAVFAMIILGRVTLPLRALLANLCGIDHKGARAPLTPLAWAKNFQVVECVVRLFGILNITEDSFSDGGLYLAPHRALEHARSLIAAGADVVDVGPASSHPDSTPVSSATQIDRLRPILASELDKRILSVDCTSADVQRFAIEHGVGYLNDIRGFCEPEIYPLLADSSVRLVVMHSISNSEVAKRMDVSPAHILDRVLRFFDERLETLLSSGISSTRVILDPGMGFFLGTDPETSIEVLRHVREIKDRYSLPILISVSRKSFLQTLAGATTGTTEAATLAAEIFCFDQGVDFIRTHDPKRLQQAIAVWKALRGWNQ